MRNADGDWVFYPQKGLNFIILGDHPGVHYGPNRAVFVQAPTHEEAQKILARHAKIFRWETQGYI